jgi:hypothetical protein
MSLINGYEYDYNSIEFAVNGIVFTGIQSIDYTESMERSEVRGTTPKVLSFTRGQYKAEGSFEMLKRDYDLLTSALTNKFDSNFSATISYSNPGDLITVDEIIGMKLTEVGKSHSVGTDALVVSCSFVCVEIKENGKSSVANSDALAGLLAVGTSLSRLL